MRQEQERQAKVIEKKVQAVEVEFNDNQNEIIRVITEMDNCFCLLIPKPEDTFGNNESLLVEEAENNNINLREHGFSTTHSVNIENFDLGRVVETEDNLPIIENLKDLNTLLKNRFLSLIKKWVAISSKAGIL